MFGRLAPNSIEHVEHAIAPIKGGQGRVAGSGPSGPGPGQQLAAHAVELTDMAPPEAAQEGPQGAGDGSQVWGWTGPPSAVKRVWTAVAYNETSHRKVRSRACLRSSTEGFDLVRSKRYRVSTASLIVVCRSMFRYCYACRRAILPQTGAWRLLRQAQYGTLWPTILYGRQYRAVQGHLFGDPSGYQAVVGHGCANSLLAATGPVLFELRSYGHLVRWCARRR